jgi:hypothetical protein
MRDRAAREYDPKEGRNSHQTIKGTQTHKQSGRVKEREKNTLSRHQIIRSE